MSVEWACNPKFRPDGEYTVDDFISRCFSLIERQQDRRLRELLASYIGWAREFGYTQVIRWRREDGWVIPYVRHGDMEIGPDGEYQIES